MDPYEAKLVAHEAFASAMAGACSVGASLAGPFWGPVVELGSAAVTAGVAAHAVETTARARGTSSRLRSAARDAVKRADAPLAAHALDIGCRVRAGDPRALRQTAVMLGACTTGRAGSAVRQWLFGWWEPLRAARVAVAAVDAAADSACFLNELHRAATEPLPRRAVAFATSPFASSVDSSAANDGNRLPNESEVAA